MSRDMPDISVLIPCCNYGRYVERAIRSALEQCLDRLEVIVVDDASTDDSWEVISRLEASDSRIRAFRNETNLGLARNLRRAVDLARGRRLAFLSADDYLLPGHLHRLLSVHAEHPEIDYVFTPYFRIDEGERMIDCIGHAGHLRGSYFGGRNEFAGLLTYDCYTSMPTTLFDREGFIRAGGLDLELTASDYDLYLCLAQRGKSFAFLDVPGVCFRVHGKGASDPSRYLATGKQLLEQVVILERHLTERNQSLVSGHERGIERLLHAKINNLNAHPQAAAATLSDLQPRIAAITARLNHFLAATIARSLPREPRVSVVLPCRNDIRAAAETIECVTKQSYQNWELILVTDSSIAAMPFLTDRARGFNVKHVSHTAPQPPGAALNDGACLASGEIVTYAQPAVAWPSDHLARIVHRFRAEPIEALVAALSEPHALAGGDGTPPLAALAHLYRIFDRIGGFNERLLNDAPTDFVRRIMRETIVAREDGDSRAMGAS
jgi:glycosyltransferase involved in cell wall biosynthesis